MGAPLALVRAASLYARKLGGPITAGAIKVSPVAHLKQVIEASVLGLKLRLELVKGEGFRAHRD